MRSKISAVHWAPPRLRLRETKRLKKKKSCPKSGILLRELSPRVSRTRSRRFRVRTNTHTHARTHAHTVLYVTAHNELKKCDNICQAIKKKNGFSKGSTQLWSPRNKVVYIVCTRAHQESQWLMCQGSKYPGKVAATWYTSHSNKNFISADRNTADYLPDLPRVFRMRHTHLWSFLCIASVSAVIRAIWAFYSETTLACLFR